MNIAFLNVLNSVLELPVNDFDDITKPYRSVSLKKGLSLIDFELINQLLNKQECTDYQFCRIISLLFENGYEFAGRKLLVNFFQERSKFSIFKSNISISEGLIIEELFKLSHKLRTQIVTHTNCEILITLTYLLDKDDDTHYELLLSFIPSNVDDKSLKLFKSHLQQLSAKKRNLELLYFLQVILEDKNNSFYSAHMSLDKAIKQYPANKYFYRLLRLVLPQALAIGFPTSISRYVRNAPEDLINTKHFQKNLAEYYQSVEQYNKSIEHIDQALSLDEENEVADIVLKIMKADIYFNMFEENKACTILTDLMEEENIGNQYIVAIGEIFFQHKKYADARIAFEKSLSIETTYDSLYLLLEIGKALKQEREFSLYVSSFMENYDDLFTEEDFYILAWYFYKDQEYKMTYDLLSNAITFKENEHKYYYLRSLCRFEMNDKIGAIEDVTSAMTLAPNRLKYYQKRIEFKEDMEMFESQKIDIEEMNLRFGSD